MSVGSSNPPPYHCGWLTIVVVAVMHEMNNRYVVVSRSILLFCTYAKERARTIDNICSDCVGASRAMEMSVSQLQTHHGLLSFWGSCR